MAPYIEERQDVAAENHVMTGVEAALLAKRAGAEVLVLLHVLGFVRAAYARREASQFHNRVVVPDDGFEFNVPMPDMGRVQWSRADAKMPRGGRVAARGRLVRGQIVPVGAQGARTEPDRSSRSSPTSTAVSSTRVGTGSPHGPLVSARGSGQHAGAANRLRGKGLVATTTGRGCVRPRSATSTRRCNGRRVSALGGRSGSANAPAELLDEKLTSRSA